MTIKAKQKLILTILAVSSFTLEAFGLEKPQITFTIKSERAIGPWSATPDAIESLEEEIQTELQVTAGKLCTSVESIPVSESEPVFTSVFDVSLFVKGVQSFTCEVQQAKNPEDPKP